MQIVYKENLQEKKSPSDKNVLFFYDLTVPWEVMMMIVKHEMHTTI